MAVIIVATMIMLFPISAKLPVDQCSWSTVCQLYGNAGEFVKRMFTNCWLCVLMLSLCQRTLADSRALPAVNYFAKLIFIHSRICSLYHTPHVPHDMYHTICNTQVPYLLIALICIWISIRQHTYERQSRAICYTTQVSPHGYHHTGITTQVLPHGNDMYTVHCT